MPFCNQNEGFLQEKYENLGKLANAMWNVYRRVILPNKLFRLRWKAGNIPVAAGGVFVFFASIRKKNHSLTTVVLFSVQFCQFIIRESRSLGSRAITKISQDLDRGSKIGFAIFLWHIVSNFYSNIGRTTGF